MKMTPMDTSHEVAMSVAGVLAVLLALAGDDNLDRMGGYGWALLAVVLALMMYGMSGLVRRD